jgi:hypothetical protein
MNDDKTVIVEHNDPERNGILHTIGELQEGSHHLLLISETMEKLDLYTYTIIPKNFVRKITPIKFK